MTNAERLVFVRCADRFHREIVLYQDRWYDHIMVDHRNSLAERRRFWPH